MSAPLSEQQLAAIRARAEAATPGPWEPYPAISPTFYGYLRGEYLRGVGDINLGVGEQAEADLAFVLAARMDVPVLLAEVERLQAERHTTNEALSDAAEAIRAKDKQIAELEARLRVVGSARTYRLESGKKFLYVEDIADAVLGRNTGAGGSR